MYITALWIIFFSWNDNITLYVKSRPASHVKNVIQSYELNFSVTCNSWIFCMVNVLKFWTLFACFKGLDKQGRPWEALSDQGLPYKHFVNSSLNNQHFVWKKKSVQNFRTVTDVHPLETKNRLSIQDSVKSGFFTRSIFCHVKATTASPIKKMTCTGDFLTVTEEVGHKHGQENSYLFVCLFDLILYVPSTIFQL